MLKNFLNLLVGQQHEVEPDPSLWSPSGWSMATGGDARAMAPVTSPVGIRRLALKVEELEQEPRRRAA